MDQYLIAALALVWFASIVVAYYVGLSERKSRQRSMHSDQIDWGSRGAWRGHAVESVDTIEKRARRSF